MKLIVAVLLLSLVCIHYSDSVKVTTWGNVNLKFLGIKFVHEDSSWLRKKQLTFTFPVVCIIMFFFFFLFSNQCKMCVNYLKIIFYFQYPYPTNQIIYGIKHIDFKQHPINVTFLDGNIGSRTVTIHCESQRGHGINSTFVFYTT